MSEKDFYDFSELLGKLLTKKNPKQMNKQKHQAEIVFK